MKIKPLYIYIILFASFIIGVIVFTNISSSSSNDKTTNKIPDDEIHKGMGNDGEMPSGMNVMEDARKKLEELKLSYEKNPDDTLKIKEYAEMLKFAHQTEKSIELYEKIIKKGPDRIDVLLELTFLYFNNGNLDKAEKYTNDILKINKDHQIGTYNLGAIAASRGDNAKAKSIWQGLAKKYPNTDIALIAQQSIMELEKANQK
ncbi:MAG: tetratricopeptide repeat protein [Melioribacter sp.]|nr:tetratricopeptide repeat protein [Melioribacter sp.]